jgi:hypothetical protein
MKTADTDAKDRLRSFRQILAIRQPHGRFTRALRASAKSDHQPIGFRKVERPDQPRVDDAEDGYRGTDGDGERCESDNREAGTPEVKTSGVLPIPDEVVSKGHGCRLRRTRAERERSEFV